MLLVRRQQNCSFIYHFSGTGVTPRKVKHKSNVTNTKIIK